MQRGLIAGVDTGGTFTDVFAADGTVRKVPSTPANPAGAIVRGLTALGDRPIESVAHGTTVATNAVLERKGATTALITTAGFEDILAIRRQNRPSLYDFFATWPDPLVPGERRLGVSERLDYRGETLLPLDPADAAAAADAVEGQSVAVCLLYSYTNPAHEEVLRTALHARWGDQIDISLSSAVAPQYGEYERASTTVVNAYVMPVLRRYLTHLQDDLEAMGVTALHVMHSNGGLISAQSAAQRPVVTILSGPAAGVVGAQAVALGSGHAQIITFDMGGTSTDVAVVPGEILEGSEGEVSSFPLLVPMLTIETVGAGGGSIARVDAAGGLHVGPESAGAVPGPAAYGVGDRPTVTDANLVLGRLSPAGLLGGAMPLELGRAREALARIAGSLGMTVEQAAWSVVRLANSNMERAVRAVTLQRGYDPGRFALFPFGGAGPLHAAELAEGLGCGTVLVPPHPGVMAALGLTVPDVVRDLFRTVLLPLSSRTLPLLEEEFARLEADAAAELAAERFEGFGEARFERIVDLRYAGQSFDLRVPFDPSIEELVRRFRALYETRYGYVIPGGAIEVVNTRVRAVLPRLEKPRLVPDWPEPERSVSVRAVWFGTGMGASEVSPHDTPVYWRPSLPASSTIAGPAILEQYDSTTVVPPGWAARVDHVFNLELHRQEP